MKRAFWLVLLLGATVSSWASGLIIIHDSDFWHHPPPPYYIPVPPPRVIPPAPVWAPLEVTYNKAETKIKDQIAVTSVDQEFYNPNPRQLEGTFLFPVPKGAQVNKFTMEINGKQVQAELLAADKARGIYEDIVRKLKDPALLEYAGRDLFKVRIFPIEANSKKRITLSYSQVLKADGGLIGYVLPLNTEKFSAKPLKNVSVKVELETKRPLKSIYSPSHKVEVKRHGANKATVGYEGSDVKPDTDFQLFYTMDEADIGISLLTHKTAGEEGYFILLATPGAESRNTRVIAKDVAFVLDTSGSMAGAKLEQAKKALLFCVENLNDGDRFEVMRFATEVEPLFDKLTEASKENRSRARGFIEKLQPIGGTAIDDALRKAVAMRPQNGDRPFVVIFLTDGRPTVGTTDESQIVEHVMKSNKANTRIFCFGIGTDVNTHLLDKITEETKAFSQYVLPEEDIEIKVSNFFTKIKEPVLANPRIHFPESVRVTKMYPSPLPDLFKGEQLVVVGRYAGKGEGAVQIEGDVSGETRKFADDIQFADEASDHEFIPRLWAARRVGYLLDEIRLRGESKELKDEVTELARRYGIVTPYTAYLILEDEQQRGVAHNAQTLHFENRTEARRELLAKYDSVIREKAGEQAVGGARSLYRLKSAEAPMDAITQGNEEIARSYAFSAPAGPFSAGGRGSAVAPAPAAGINIPAVTLAEGARQRSNEYTQQSRFVGGRTFFHNNGQWTDSQVQSQPNAKKVRLQFDSAEYFELLKKHPQAVAWLSLGRNVQFVLGDTLYEIHE